MNFGISFLVLFFMYVLAMAGVYLVNHPGKTLLDVFKAPFK